MIYKLIDLPTNVIGFNLSWDVRERDFEEVMIPLVKDHQQTGELNCILVVRSLKKIRLEALRFLKHIATWHRIAIVVESKVARRALSIVNFFIRGTCRVFWHDEIDKAINWVSNKN